MFQLRNSNINYQVEKVVWYKSIVNFVNYLLANSHQSFCASNFNILCNFSGPSLGNYTILEHTVRLAMHRQTGGYFIYKKC